MERVREACRLLEMSGQCLTIKAVIDATGITRSGLYKYDRVKAFLREKLFYIKHSLRVRDPQFEEQLLEKAQQAIQELLLARKPITYCAVSDLLSVPKGAIVKYPRLKKFLDQFVEYAQQFLTAECEQSLLEQVRTTVMALEELHLPVTYQAISKKIGIRSDTWLAYAQIRAFVEQHLDSRYLRRLREQREEALIPHVLDALNELETTGKSVTFTSVGMLLGIHPSTFKTYPRVHVLIEQRKGAPREREGQPRRSERRLYLMCNAVFRR